MCWGSEYDRGQSLRFTPLVPISPFSVCSSLASKTRADLSRKVQGKRTTTALSEKPPNLRVRSFLVRLLTTSCMCHAPCAVRNPSLPLPKGCVRRDPHHLLMVAMERERTGHSSPATKAISSKACQGEGTIEWSVAACSTYAYTYMSRNGNVCCAGQCVFLEVTFDDVTFASRTTTPIECPACSPNLNTGSRAPAYASRSPAHIIGVTVLLMDLTR